MGARQKFHGVTVGPFTHCGRAMADFAFLHVGMPSAFVS